MKLLKIISAGSVALSCVGFASATVTDIYVSGSTAYRSTVVTAEGNLLTGGVSSAYIGASLTKASTSAVHGIDANGNEVIFHNHWTGSVAGLTDLCNAHSLSQIPDSSVPALGGGSVSLATGSDTASAQPQISMCDCVYSDAAQILSGANGTGKTAGANITLNAPTDGGTASGANGNPVATVDFEFLLGSLATGNPIPANWQASSGGLTGTGAMPLNITQDQAEALIAAGSLPLSIITGNASDANSVVVYIGRNEDSGTRALYQAESAANGITGNKGGLGGATIQWMIQQQNGGVAVTLPQNSTYGSLSIASGITALQEWPQNNFTNPTGGVNGWSLYSEVTISWNTAGHSGYNSGGDVASILASPNPVTGLTGTPSGYTNVYVVSCIGIADAQSALTASPAATALSYNGVPYSIANIESGQYALWNYEHLYYLTGSETNAIASGSIPRQDADALADYLYNGAGGLIGGATTAGIPGVTVDASPLRTQSAGSQIK